jgi:hypothetical protein
VTEGRRTSLALVVAVLGALLLAACAPPTGGGTGGGVATSWAVNPRTTDPAIGDDPFFTHIALAPTVAPRNELVVLFHGTSSSPQAYTEIAGGLRGDGYHVISLRYAGAYSTLSACPDSAAATDPDCHRTFRSETVYGEDVTDPDGGSYDHPLVVIDAANSVMNRLLKVVEYLRVIAPTAGWDQFQVRTGATCDVVDPTYGACDLRWDRVVTMGHSQGAGVALYLAKHHGLDRVGMLSGSYDAFSLGGGSYAVAPWISEGGLDVPASRISVFNHTSDFGIGVFRAVEDSLGLAGPEVQVTSAAPPYSGSHRLITTALSTCPWESTPNHLSTAVDACSPDGLYLAAWRHLAGS